MHVATLCIVRLQVVHCRAVGPLSPLLLVVVVVEVPLLWSTTLQGEVLEVLSSAMLLLLEGGGVLTQVVFGCGCLCAVGVLLLRVLRLEEARLWDNWLARVPFWMCVGSGESSRGRVGSSLVAAVVGVVVGCCIAAVVVSCSSSLLVSGFSIAVVLSMSVSSLPPSSCSIPVIPGRPVRPVSSWPVSVSCCLSGFEIGSEGVFRDVGVLVESVLSSCVLEVGCPSSVDYSCSSHYPVQSLVCCIAVEGEGPRGFFSREHVRNSAFEFVLFKEFLQQDSCLSLVKGGVEVDNDSPGFMPPPSVHCRPVCNIYAVDCMEAFNFFQQPACYSYWVRAGVHVVGFHDFLNPADEDSCLAGVFHCGSSSSCLHMLEFSGNGVHILLQTGVVFLKRGN